MSELFTFVIQHGLVVGFISGFISFFIGFGLRSGLSLFQL